MTSEHRVSQDRGAPPKCQCEFSKWCPPERQKIAYQLEVANVDCIVYGAFLTGTNPTSREDIRTPF